MRGREAYDVVMALTEQERARIREEEWVRLQAQEDFRRTGRKMWKAPVIAAACMGIALLAIGLLRTNTPASHPPLRDSAVEQRR
jgi:hypothetical protein